MKILVIDDNPMHLKAAEITLAGHELTLCSSADEALELLEVSYDKEISGRIMTERGFGPGVKHEFGKEFSAAAKAAYDAARRPYWDAVLTDLIMPAPKRSQGPNGLPFVGKPMPIGWGFVMTAARNGAKYIVCATDMDHHQHPASAMLDDFKGTVFTVNSSRVMYTEVGKTFVPGTVCEKCHGTGKDGKSECWECYDSQKKTGTGVGKGKNWGSVLQYLLEKLK